MVSSVAKYLVLLVATCTIIPSLLDLRFFVSARGSLQCPDRNAGCMNDENWHECKEIEESGCQDLLILESCPLQFRCGDKDDGSSLRCPDRNDGCMNDQNWRECNDIEESGCRDLLVLESCPLQFRCGDKYSPPFCPSMDGECVDKENWKVCKELEEDGCQDYYHPNLPRSIQMR